jgi:hypothetical protein
MHQTLIVGNTNRGGSYSEKAALDLNSSALKHEKHTLSNKVMDQSSILIGSFLVRLFAVSGRPKILKSLLAAFLNA